MIWAFFTYPYVYLPKWQSNVCTLPWQEIHDQLFDLMYIYNFKIKLRLYLFTTNQVYTKYYMLHHCISHKITHAASQSDSNENASHFVVIWVMFYLREVCQCIAEADRRTRMQAWRAYAFITWRFRSVNFEFFNKPFRFWYTIQSTCGMNGRTSGIM